MTTDGHGGCAELTDVHVTEGLGWIVGALQRLQTIDSGDDDNGSLEEIGPLLSVSEHP